MSCRSIELGPESEGFEGMLGAQRKLLEKTEGEQSHGNC